MRTPTGSRRLASAIAAAVVLAACSGDDAIRGMDAVDEPSSPQDPTAETEDADRGGTTGSGEAMPVGAGVVTGDGVVDLTEAVPGTWPVGDAGTVTFSIVDGRLALDGVTTNDGWSVAIDGQEPDGIEVTFTRGNAEWEIEIALGDDGRTLRIEIDQDLESAEPGSYEIGDSGTFAFRVVDGRLVLTDLDIAAGWILVDLEEGSDGIEFALVDGARSFQVEVELEEDGTIELEIDFEVTGPLTR